MDICSIVLVVISRSSDKFNDGVLEHNERLPAVCRDIPHMYTH